MIEKHPIHPRRVRKVPKQFSWLDNRLVRDHYLDRCSHPAATLYLFLVTVADAEGLSWYSEAALCRHLSLTGTELQSARAELQQAGLIAYREPLYQVLDLSPVVVSGASSSRRGSEAVSVGEILRHILPAYAGTHADKGGAQ